MKSYIEKSLLAVVLLLNTVLHAQVAVGDSSNVGSSADSVVIEVPKVDLADRAWNGALPALNKRRTTAEDSLQTANVMKDFADQYPNDHRKPEARRLEAVMLVEAVAGGLDTSRRRMEATVQAFLAEKSLPAAERAIVAGTYEFYAAGRRIKTLADMRREYESVARELIRDFPDQPQGYVSLLTQAMEREPKVCRALAREVAEATAAPVDARRAASRLINRLDLVGRALSEILEPALLRTGEADGWKRDKPGLIYFWASWSPESVALAEQLAARLADAPNVLSICLDRQDGVLEIGERTPGEIELRTAPKVVGRSLELIGGLDGALATQLGADMAPSAYLIDASGKIVDVFGLTDLEAKLKKIGL